MNILFDLITTYKATGASEYVRRVFYSLMQKSSSNHNIRIYGLYDSNKGEGVYNDISKLSLEERGITCIDISQSSIEKIVQKYSIDKIFIGCAQYWGAYSSLSQLKCEVICVVHDLSFEEKSRNYVDLWTHLHRGCYRFLWNYIKYIIKGAPYLDLMKPYIELSKDNNKFKFVTVSEYTKNSLVYNFNIKPESIFVLYSPERIFLKNGNVENCTLKDVITSKKKYYLLISANRPMKNSIKAIEAFKRFSAIHKDSYLITVGASKKSFENQIVLPFLSESDLTSAYANCYAFIYPTLFEGFGYPPLEAMRFGKPVLCSNVCSIPEILQNAPLYFSPLYDTEIFSALMKLTDDNYSSFSSRSLKQYKQVYQKQENDLQTLINLIIYE